MSTVGSMNPCKVRMDQSNKFQPRPTVLPLSHFLVIPKHWGKVQNIVRNQKLQYSLGLSLGLGTGLIGLQNPDRCRRNMVVFGSRSNSWFLLFFLLKTKELIFSYSLLSQAILLVGKSISFRYTIFSMLWFLESEFWFIFQSIPLGAPPRRRLEQKGEE